MPVRAGEPDNDPPVWDTTVGVQALNPGEEQIIKRTGICSLC